MSVGWMGFPGWGEPVRAFISWPEIAAIFVVILVIFGPKSIPEVARLLGKFMAQFREASAELQRNLYMDDVKEIQRELRDSWKTKPERMRTVKPGAEHDKEPEALDPESSAGDVSPEDVSPEDVSPEDVSPEDVSPESSGAGPEAETSEAPETSEVSEQDIQPEEEEDRNPS